MIVSIVTDQRSPRQQPNAPGASGRIRWNEPHHLAFLGIACAFSWTLWIAAWLIARSTGVGALLFNERLVWSTLFDARVGGAVLAVSSLALLAVYGPALAGVVATARDPATDLTDLRRRLVHVSVGGAWYRRLAMVVAVTMLVPAVGLWLLADTVPDAPDAATLVLFLPVFFAYQLLTSGTEEIGWRGYLLEKLQTGRSLWDAGWAVGLPWALWHVPVVLIMFAQQGMPVAAVIGSLAGFTMSIVALSILHAWFYINTRSIALAIVAHAAFNITQITGLLVEQPALFAVVSALAMWAVVVVIVRRESAAPLP